VLKVEQYSVTEALRGGCRVEIRALRPDDRADLLAAINRASAQSRYRRFFALKRSFTDQEAAFFVNVDFINHVALAAWIDEEGRSVIAGGARYIVLQPGEAEVAFVVVDKYQGRGIGRALMSNLTRIARAAGVRTLVAEVLPENTPMLQLFKTSGFPLSTSREGQVVHVKICLS
jgi:ribosomal protein S18 acetylase RimI-like enzyme